MMESIALRARWFACLPALPVLALQAKSLRRNIVRLPEASGVRAGCSEAGEKGEPLRIAVVGESTAVGVGAHTLADAIPGPLSRAIADALNRPVHWTVCGKNGATVKGALQVLGDCNQQFDCAVVLLGVNDVFRLTRMGDWGERMGRLIEILTTKHGCRQVLVSAVPPIGLFPALPQPLRSILGLRAAMLDQHVRQLVERFDKAQYCAVTFRSTPEYVAADGVHPSSLGYRTWAEQLALPIIVGQQ